MSDSSEQQTKLSQVLHDIKNHLMSIKGYLYIVGMKKEFKTDEQYAENLRKINEKINAITGLLDSLKK